MLDFLHHTLGPLVSANLSLSNLSVVAAIGGAIWTFIKRKKIGAKLGTFVAHLGNTGRLVRQLHHSDELLALERAENSDWRRMIKNLRDQSQLLSDQLVKLQDRLVEVEGMLEIKSANEIVLFEDRTKLVCENAALRKQLLDNHLTPCVEPSALLGVAPGVA